MDAGIKGFCRGNFKVSGKVKFKKQMNLEGNKLKEKL